PPTYTPVMAARPCSGSRPKVKGSTTITVMVIVTPGSEPPITPTNVPTASGIRYFAWRMPRSAAPRSSNMSEIRPAAARQQHEQPALEDVPGEQGRGEREDGRASPPAQPARRVEERVQPADEEERGDPEAEPGHRHGVQREDAEGHRHERAVALLRRRGCGGAAPAHGEHVRRDQQGRERRRHAEDDARIEPRPDGDQGTVLQVEREREEDEARGKDHEPRDAVPAHRFRSPRSLARLRLRSSFFLSQAAYSLRPM